MQCSHFYKTCILTIVGSSKNLFLVAWRYMQKLLRKSSIENLVFKNYLFLQNNKKKPPSNIHHLIPKPSTSQEGRKPAPTFHFLEFCCTHFLAVSQNFCASWRVCRVWLKFFLLVYVFRLRISYLSMALICEPLVRFE